MFENVKQLLHLARRTDKYWIIPIVLALIIIALLITAANISPVPIFIYPLI